MELFVNINHTHAFEGHSAYVTEKENDQITGFIVPIAAINGQHFSANKYCVQYKSKYPIE